MSVRFSPPRATQLSLPTLRSAPSGTESRPVPRPTAAPEAAFAPAAAPITLVDGDKLVDLLIERKIGVSKRTLAVLDLRLEDFDALEIDYSDQEEEAG